ncbi:uncharacterized protein LOC117129535 [Brassica rapa]|uniref:uncharacterized protein LOC117129535 n=1 Tax=Brassica campestris TaxID=3711 RepID=UPI00142DCFB3|nr:uncharacterized protein LOC117129535 [Brassica rapa]
MVRSLHLNTLVGHNELLGLEAVDQADLLTRIQQAQSLDENLQKVALNDKTEYHITSNGTILVNVRVSVPNSKELKEEIMSQAHKSMFSVHPGLNNMYKDLKRYYHWVRMKTDVAEWVARCPTCQLVKAKHQDIILPEIPTDLDKNLTLETRPVRIVDRTEKTRRKKTIPMIKVVWEYNGKHVITWETEATMKAEYP